MFVSLGLKVENLRGHMKEQLLCINSIHELQREYRTRTINNLAMYVHCYVHALNLYLSDFNSAVRAVRNMFGVLNYFHTFIEVSSKMNLFLKIFKRIKKTWQVKEGLQQSSHLRHMKELLFGSHYFSSG